MLSAANRALLQRPAMVVWLRADPATLAARVGAGEGRPLLADDPADPAGPSSTPCAARSTGRWPTWWSTSTASTPRGWSTGSWPLTAFERSRP